MLLGFLIASYEWVTTVSDMPPIIKDSRWGIGFGIFLFFISALMFMYRFLGNFVWSEPEIELSPTPDEKQIGQTYVKNAVLICSNSEQLPITECYATLEYAATIYGSDRLPLELDKYDRLKWIGQKYANDRCEIEIPPHGDRRIDVGDCLNGFHFSYCDNPGIVNAHGTGLRVVKIRIDGKYNQKSMKPLFWSGYIYIEQKLDNFEYVMTTTQKKPDGNIIKTEVPYSELLTNTTMIFKEGDWMKDNNIKKSLGIEAEEEKKGGRKEKVFTKEDFLKFLKKATRPITRKASRGKGKSKTSG